MTEATQIKSQITDISSDLESKKQEPLLSVVMPCLNEADTLGICIRKVLQTFENEQINGEIIVADNGSTDESIEIAESFAGVRVVNVTEKGYGNALMGGINAAQGKYIIMGDADDSYDFLEIPKFIEKLEKGYDLVQGCRLPGGGGTVKKGAMPFLHRWWGNPMFSLMVKLWFKAPINDVYCGLRGFTKKHYLSLNQKCTGMEFATEMIIKSSLYRETNGIKIAEVPITLHPDGRKTHAPHLKTFRDGWRTLRFFLMYSPRWLFLVPSLLFILLGILGYAIAFPQTTITLFQTPMTFDVHTLLFASLSIVSGLQIAWFALFTKVFAISEDMLPDDPRLDKFFEFLPLKRDYSQLYFCLFLARLFC